MSQIKELIARPVKGGDLKAPKPTWDNGGSPTPTGMATKATSYEFQKAGSNKVANKITWNQGKYHDADKNQQVITVRE